MSDTVTVESGTSSQVQREMNVKKPVRRWLAAGLIIVFLAGAFAVNYFLISPNSATNEATFTSTDEGFSISYPDAWKKLSDSDTAALQGGFSLAVSRDEPFAFLGIRVETMDARDSNFKEISKMLDETMPGQFTDFKKMASMTTKLKSGEEVLRYDFTFLSAEEKLIHQQLTVIPTSENVYYLGAWTEKKNFKKVETDLEEIAGSFSVKQR